MWASDPRRAGRRGAWVAALCVLLLSRTGPAWAQAAAVISDADLARARQGQPVIGDRDIERARQRNPTPTEADLARMPLPSVPNLDALPRPADRAPLNLEALARGFESERTTATMTDEGGPGLLVFISLSMPEATLARLFDQAARARASLVLRGLANGSLTQTVARTQQLIGTRRVSVQIDPQAFDRYSITRAPSFVLVRAGASAEDCGTGVCAATDTYAMAAGDVSLDYALRHFQRHAPRLAKQAGEFLRRLEQ